MILYNTAPRQNYILMIGAVVCALCALALASCKNTTDPTDPVVTPTYTVTFNANGHGIAPEEITVNENATLPSACFNTPEFADNEDTCWSFNGWFTDEAATKQFTPSTPVTQNLTLYAGWELLQRVTITYVSKHGTPPAAKIEDVNYQLSAEDVSRDNSKPKGLSGDYLFQGWRYDDNKQAKANDVITKNVTLNALWRYKVTFDPDDGDFSRSYNDGSLLELPVNAPEDPSGQNRLFDGWYCDGELMEDSTSVEKPLTIVAKWKEPVYIVTLKYNDGTGEKETPFSPIEVLQSAPEIPAKYFDPAWLKSNLLLPGFSVTGWKKDGTPISSLTLTEDTTLVATLAVEAAHVPDYIKSLTANETVSVTGELDGDTLKEIAKAIDKLTFADAAIDLDLSGTTGLTAVPKECFQPIAHLKSIRLPSTVETIEASAFSAALELEYIYIPASVKRIYCNAFKNCTALNKVEFENTTSNWVFNAGATSTNVNGYFPNHKFDTPNGGITVNNSNANVLEKISDGNGADTPYYIYIN